MQQNSRLIEELSQNAWMPECAEAGPGPAVRRTWRRKGYRFTDLRWKPDRENPAFFRPLFGWQTLADFRSHRVDPRQGGRGCVEVTARLQQDSGDPQAECELAIDSGDGLRTLERRPFDGLGRGSLRRALFFVPAMQRMKSGDDLRIRLRARTGRPNALARVSELRLRYCSFPPSAIHLRCREERWNFASLPDWRTLFAHTVVLPGVRRQHLALSFRSPLCSRTQAGSLLLRFRVDGQPGPVHRIPAQLGTHPAVWAQCLFENISAGRRGIQLEALAPKGVTFATPREMLVLGWR